MFCYVLSCCVSTDFREVNFVHGKDILLEYSLCLFFEIFVQNFKLITDVNLKKTLKLICSEKLCLHLEWKNQAMLYLSDNLPKS